MGVMVLALTGAGILQMWLQRMPTEAPWASWPPGPAALLLLDPCWLAAAWLPARPAGTSGQLLHRWRPSDEAAGLRQPSAAGLTRPAAAIHAAMGWQGPQRGHCKPSPPFYAEQGGECAAVRACLAPAAAAADQGPDRLRQDALRRAHGRAPGPPLITVSCHDDLSAADLVGRHLIGRGDTVWADGPLTRAVRAGRHPLPRRGGGGARDTTVVLHPLADDRACCPGAHRRTAAAPPEFMLVISYNPGLPEPAQKGLKPSTRQRFTALSLDYPAPAVERLHPGHARAGRPALAVRLVHWPQACAA